MGYYIVTDQTGTRKYSADTQEITTSGVTATDVADSGVLTSAISATAGLVVVKDLTTTDSAVFAIVDTAGTVATELIVTNAGFTATKDNDGTINAYVEGGVIVVQNESGGAIDINVKAIV